GESPGELGDKMTQHGKRLARCSRAWLLPFSRYRVTVTRKGSRSKPSSLAVLTANERSASSSASRAALGATRLITSSPTRSRISQRFLSASQLTAAVSTLNTWHAPEPRRVTQEFSLLVLSGDLVTRVNRWRTHVL